MAQNKISIKDFFLGGIADSKYTGIKNSMASLIGVNLHGEPGVLKVSQRLVKESGATVDEFVSKIVVCSDGNSYLFGKITGKIWKRTSAGVYTLEATNANGGILDAEEHGGYIYYASATKLGRWTIGTAWSTRTDTWATFSNGDTEFHPMKVKNLVLYIGDKNLIAQVDGTTFSANALDLELKYRIKSLGEVSNDLLIGTFISEAINTVKIFRWNTWSVSFSNDDQVFEKDINSFIPLDNIVVVQAGRKGSIYTYNGEQLAQFKRMQGDWEGSNEVLVYPNATANYKGLPLFGVSNVSGNPIKQGVYSFGAYSANYPKVLNLEFVISTGNTTNVEITSIAVAGNDILVAWKDTTSGTVYGVDKVDWSNKFSSAVLESRVIAFDRTSAKDFDVKILYRSLPAGTDILLYKKVNNGAWTAVTLVTDATHSLKYANSKISDVYSMQLKVALTASGNTAPEIEEIELNF